MRRVLFRTSSRFAAFGRHARCVSTQRHQPRAPLGVAAAAAAACGLAAASQVNWPATASKTESTRLYTIAELRKMVTDDRIVVAYQGGLYDVTDFTGHPGGVGRLQMAAGGDLDVFWGVYTQHNRGHIAGILNKYKIGEVSKDDMRQITKDTYYDKSAYAGNPEPYPGLLVNTLYPYNAEGRLSGLTDSFFTPEGKHFVRNHCAVPKIDPGEYRLTVTGKGLKEIVFTLEDLKTKFPKATITTVIQCNGNRREDYHFVDGENPAFGPPHWVSGAIGCSQWSGVRMRDLLRAGGMNVDAISLRQEEAPENAVEVGLLGYDHDEVGNQYCCSFPFDKAIDPFGDVLVAYEMNGKDIPPSHGYPVRAIVPGHAGARNCKFLECISVTDTPCAGNGNWKQYAVHAPDVPMEKLYNFELHRVELKKDLPVQEMPVQSFITSPQPHEIISAIKNGDESLYVKGLAWGGGGAGVNRVDVSLNNGKDFTRAEMLEKPIKQRRRSEWSWVFFEKRIPIPENMREKLRNGEKLELTLTSKALNSAWNMQPESPEPNWNPHGCCVNHWYRVPVTVCPKAKENIKAAEGDFANKPSGGKFTTPFRNLDTPEMSKRLGSKELSEKAAGIKA